MPARVHVFSGDEAAARYREGGGTEPTVVWREALIAGPLGAPPGSTRWHDERATFLAAYAGVAPEECRAALRRQEAELAAAMDAEEVVLWFAHDLFCELSLLYILSAIARGRRRPSRLTLVQPAESGTRAFPCFGALPPAALVECLDARRAIDDGELDAARAAWDAVGAASPARLDVLASGTDSFADVARRQRARFPAVRNGLGVTERAALRALDDAPASLAVVLESVGAALPAYGWTDLQIAAELGALARGGRPLVREAGHGYALTPDGRAVLAGTADRAALSPVEGWLGGVRLAPDALWRWDAARDRLVAPA